MQLRRELAVLRLGFLQILQMTVLRNPTLCGAVEIDNGVAGEPTINCGTDFITFWVKTRNKFAGKVYVKGEYGKGECSRSFDGADTSGGIIDVRPSTKFPPGPVGRPDTCPPCPACREGSPVLQPRQVAPGGEQSIPEMAHLSVKLGTCNLKRERSLTPAGVQVTFTVVVSFHEHFVTKVDRAYQIQCAYMEADKTVTSAIDVSMPTTAELTAAASMPTCEYTIHRDSPDGPEIRFARVGDAVWHKWQCQSQMSDMFGMLVHDCYVDDGEGQRVLVVDENGCSVDQFVLPDLNYDGTLLVASVEAHVFKFADRAVLDFQCSMSICVQTDEGCEGITPPTCDGSNGGRVLRARRSVLVERVNRTAAPPPDGQLDANEWRLHAQRLTVVDIDDNIDTSELAELERRLSEKRHDATHAGDQEPSEADGWHDDGQSVGDRLRHYRRLLQRSGPRVCLSIAGFGVLVSLCTFVFTMAAVTLGGSYVLRRQRRLTQNK